MLDHVLTFIQTFILYGMYNSLGSGFAGSLRALAFTGVLGQLAMVFSYENYTTITEIPMTMVMLSLAGGTAVGQIVVYGKIKLRLP